MAFPDNPLWTFLKGYFVSTYCSHKSEYKTMVYPASPEAKKVMRGFTEQVEGVDFDRPFDEYTKCYATVDDAKTGHKATVKAIKELIKKGTVSEEEN